MAAIPRALKPDHRDFCQEIPPHRPGRGERRDLHPGRNPGYRLSASHRKATGQTYRASTLGGLQLYQFQAREPISGQWLIKWPPSQLRPQLLVKRTVLLIRQKSTGGRQQQEQQVAPRPVALSQLAWCRVVFSLGDTTSNYPDRPDLEGVRQPAYLFADCRGRWNSPRYRRYESPRVIQNRSQNQRQSKLSTGRSD